MTEPEDVLRNLERIRGRIAKAAIGCGRDPKNISLVAVTKTMPSSTVEAAIAAGHRVFGENKVQEAAEKFQPLKERCSDLALHLIGPLQTNKVRQAVEIADCIQTLDREKLARVLAEEFHRQGKTCDLLIQVNTGEEPQKSGVMPKDADRFIERCRQDFKLPIIGLMCIPPVEEHPAPHFALLREIALRHDLRHLSMGMSEDFETAIQFGATIVRVGSAIFGARPT